MRRKWKLTIIGSLVIIVLFSLLIPLLFFILTKHTPLPGSNFVYPNTLFHQASFSDMTLESDNKIHFAFESYKEESYGPTYGFLNTENKDNHSFTFEPIKPTTIFSDQYQIRIILNASLEPLIYYYFGDGFGYYRSSFFIKNNDIWNFAPFYDNLTMFLLNNGPMLDFHYLPSGELVYANIYQELRISYEIFTPILYNDHNQEVFFLNNTFPEIMDSISYSPGDFCITNTSTIVFWTSFLAPDSYYPYLAVNWEDIGWQIYEVGKETKHLLARAISPGVEGFSAFYYDDGPISNASKLYMLKMYNSSYFTSKIIALFDGRVNFYEDSIQSLSQNCYVFLYSKSPTRYPLKLIYF